MSGARYGVSRGFLIGGSGDGVLLHIFLDSPVVVPVAVIEFLEDFHEAGIGRPGHGQLVVEFAGRIFQFQGGGEGEDAVRRGQAEFVDQGLDAAVAVIQDAWEFRQESGGKLPEGHGDIPAAHEQGRVLFLFQGQLPPEVLIREEVLLEKGIEATNLEFKVDGSIKEFRQRVVHFSRRPLQIVFGQLFHQFFLGRHKHQDIAPWPLGTGALTVHLEWKNVPFPRK